MSKSLKVLIAACSDTDARGLAVALRALGYASTVQRIMAAEDLQKAVQTSECDLLVCASSVKLDALPAALTATPHPPAVVLVGGTLEGSWQSTPGLHIEHVDNALSGFEQAVRRAAAYATVRQAVLTNICAAKVSAIAAATLHESVIVLDTAGRVASLNDAAERLLGRAAADAIALPLNRLIAAPAGDGIAESQHGPRLAPGRGAGDVRCEDDTFFTKEGVAVPVSWTMRSFGDGGSCEGAIVVVQDLRERRHLEQVLRERGLRDSLTGLPNWSLFRERIGDALLRTDEGAGRIAVLFIDIDRFGVVNDSLGHATGDQLLVEIGQRLARRLGTGAVLARFAGDQFVALLDHVDKPADAAAVAEMLIEELRAPFLLQAREVFITASIGVAVSGGKAERRPGDLLRNADTALHRAKAAGRGRYRLVDNEAVAAPHLRLELESDLWRALQRGEIEVHYQPVHDLASTVAVGVEALARWTHPRHGTLMPVTFVPLAEDLGLMVSIGRWVLEESCRQMRSWHDRSGGRTSLSVSVNLSADEFQHPDLVRQVAAVLKRTELPPQCLVLEITEGILMVDAPSTLRSLRALKRLGVRLAVDDFGTGYSSLSYLRRFPVDIVKIDKSLIEPLRADGRSTAIVRAVSALAHDLGMSVTAEGIENDVQLKCLRKAACDHGQGYYFSPAAPVQHAERALGVPAAST